MNTNEKLKQASLEAELAELKNTEEFDWTPSADFERKMETALNKKRVPVRRYIALIAAAMLLLVATLAFLIPMMRNDSESQGEDISENGENSTIIDSVDIPAQPEYIPEGYYMNSCTVWADGSLQIEYIDGENQILFQSYPASAVDLSVFEEVVSNVDINGNQGFAANNFNGCLNNNIAWADGQYSYVITNSVGVNLEELVKIAISVEREESE